MIEKQILLEQLNDRVVKAIALIVDAYPRLYAGELEEELIKGTIDLADSLRYIMSAIADIKYNNNIEQYKDVIYQISHKEE